MSISYLKNRQIGSKYRLEFRNSNSSLNLDHVLSRLACHKDDIFTIRGEEMDVPPFACKFRRDTQSDLLAVANEDGDISLYDSSKRHPENVLKTFVAHHNAIFDICWLPDKCQLFSASGDHNATLWDMTSCNVISVFKKHTASVKSVDVCCEQSAMFATGSRDGSINVWDTRDKDSCVRLKPAVSISYAHCRKKSLNAIPKKFLQKDPVSSVSAVVFQDSNNLASAGVADGIVKIWDLRRTYSPNLKQLPLPKHQMKYAETIGHGCTSLVFDSRYKTLYGCTTDHKILKFNCHSYAKEADVYDGFRCTTYFIKLALSNDDQYLLCGSNDCTAYVWKTSKPGLPIMKLGAHSAEVTSVSWSPYDITKLVTCGDDNKVAIWKIAEAEIPSINDENIVAVAEPYTEDPKNENPPSQVIAQSSTTICNLPIKKSPTLLIQTPNKPAMRSIMSFFSPLTAISASTPIKDIQSTATLSSNNSSSPPNKLLNWSSKPESSSQVLTPYNHIHKNNSKQILQHFDDKTGTISSPEWKDTSLENENCSPSFLSSSLSVQNKENSGQRISPEVVYNRNSIGQTKRKIISKHPTPKLKRRQSESSKKTKGIVKQGKKITSEKNIMSYFSVSLSPDN